MQWKIFFCAISMFAPLSLMAQGPRVGEKDAQKSTSQEKEVTIGANAKVVTIDSIANNTATKPQLAAAVNPSSVSNNALLNVNPSVKPRDIAPNDKFKPVPLAGELDYYGKNNGYMINYVKNYMATRNKTLRVVTDRSEGIFSVMDKVLQQHDIPSELKYLAVIESALNKNALSPVGARGYWQFMSPTARMMGLTVNGRRDDRTDLVRSTHAAAKYLSYLYDQLDDWLLVVAAYNSGPRPVINAIRRTGKSNYWAIKKYLPAETQNHVLAFVATATIMERMDHFLDAGLPANFDWASLNNTLPMGGVAKDSRKFTHPLLSKFSEDEVKTMAIVRITKPLDLELLCNELKTDRRQIGRWNYDYYDYMDTYKSGNSYNLRIPKDKLDRFIERKDFIERNSGNIM